MDLKRFFIIVFVSIIFILLFCNDTIEGQTDGVPDDGTIGSGATDAVDDTVDGAVDDTADGATDAADGAADDTVDGAADDTADDTVDGATDDATDDATDTVDGAADGAVDDTADDAVDDTADDADADDDDEEEKPVFGVDCLSNCEVYFHDCEVKRERENVDGKRRIVKTYGNIEECPNGLIPEENCDDGDWGCRQCKAGFYVDVDNLCKPNTSVLTLILYSVLFLIIGGILLFVGNIIKGWIIKGEWKAKISGFRRTGLFPTITQSTYKI